MTGSEGKYDVIVERNVEVPMRDGTVLRADIWRPDVDGEFPVLIERTPYDKTSSSESSLGAGEYYASEGYVTIIQDVRGRFASDGEFYPFRDDGDGDRQDGYDTVEWAAEQQWSNGKIGTIGGSYSGSTQYRMLSAQPPHLVAQFARQSASDYYREWVYRGGAIEHGFNLKWALVHTASHARRLAPAGSEDRVEKTANQAVEEYKKWLENTPVAALAPVVDLQDWFKDWMDHPNDDDFWHEFSIVRAHDRVNVPVHHFGSWYDCFLRGTLENYTGMRDRAATPEARAAQRLTIGPWVHNPGPGDLREAGAVDFGEQAQIGWFTTRLRWFDHWLKGVDNGVDADRPVKLFAMGINRWREFDKWPPAGITYTPFYLSEGISGSAGSLNDGVLATDKPDLRGEVFDEYDSDPENPVRSFGGGHLGDDNGPQDQRGCENRVLTYTTAVLEQPLDVTGPVRAVLHASSSAVDTDWVVRITDVWADGTSMLVCDGILRARFKDSFEEPISLVPGIPVEFEVDLWATSHVFQKGHRLRVAVASSSFPRWDRNWQTGRNNAYETSGTVARNRIFRDATRPSHVLLPVLG
ncbi:MAG: CocE/NonD family hydrolase [Chloroflexi bacterium]|nr:CocE/NonD family hydrolase [Chloroflexota bacterium]